MFSTGLSSGAREGRKTRVMFFGTTERRLMRAGPIEEEHGVGAAADTARDLDEVELHRLAVGVGHGERRAGAARRADGAEQVGAFVALIGGLAWARAAPRPLPHEAVLLADAGFVLEPDLDRLAFRQAGAVSVQRRGEVFLKAATVSSSLAGWRGRALTCEKPSCSRILPIVRSWRSW